MMDEKPRFVILKQIGHGQFSTVYKARWVNAPIGVPIGSTQQVDSTMQAPVTDDNLHSSNYLSQDEGKQILKQTTKFDLNDCGNQSSDNNLANINSGEKYVALKRIKFFDIQNSKLRMDYFKEVKLLQQLKHPNIINYNISFIERNELFIVLELADGGDLSKLIKYFQKRKQLLIERTILKYFTQVCSAVKYIHSKRILHRDIKPANIFMTSNGCVKLGDFGLGRFFSQNTRDAHSIVGTFYYMSPERIRELGYGFSSDVWSLGCVLYELITLNSPFSMVTFDYLKNNNNPFRQQQTIQHEPQPQPPQQQHHHQQQQQPQQNPFNLQWLIERIMRAEYPGLEQYLDISLRLRQLTTECLNPNPEARPNMEYICAVVGEAYRLQQLPPSRPTSVSNGTSSNVASIFPTSG